MSEEEKMQDMLNKVYSLHNPEILYALYRASECTGEKIQPERLIELAGLYSPPNSLEKINIGLVELSEAGYVRLESGAYSLTDSDLIIARSLPTISEKASLEDLKTRLKKIDKIFEKGV